MRERGERREKTGTKSEKLRGLKVRLLYLHNMAYIALQKM